MTPSAPRLVRWLVARLPAGTREAVGQPLEGTAAEALAHARRRGRRAWLVTFVRETASLAALVIRERMGAGGPKGHGPEEWMTMWGQEIRYAFRTLRRSPAVTAVCVLTLALGIGANTAIFSVVDGVLLNNLAYHEPDRVVYLGERTPEGGFSSTSWENLRDWQASGALAAVGAVVGNSVNVTGEGAPERIRGIFVTASYFDVVGVRPAVGRAIQPGEDEPGAPRTAVLSWGYWQQRFGGDDVLGRTILLNNEPHTIVGVMPEGFRSPWDTPSAWISMHTAPRSFNRADRVFQAAIGRLRPGQSVEQARTAMEGVMAGLVERYPEENAGRGIWMEPLGPFLAARNRPVLLGLAGAVALLLLIACANVANLQLSRATSRRQELAVRAALGGGRRRLLRQVLVENGLLFGVGGLVGLGVAALGVRGLVALMPPFGAYYRVALDLPVALAGMALAVGTGLAFGLIPALEAVRTRPAGALREGGRASSGGRTVRRFRSGLVVAQVALSVSLLVGAGLLVRSMGNLLGLDPGFEKEGLLTLEFRLPANVYDEDPTTVVFFDRMLEEVGAVPGVEAAAVAQDLPFSGNGGTQPFILEGAPLEMDRAPDIRRNVVSPGYFETMGIPVLAGRGLRTSDRAETEAVAVVSRAAVEQLFDGEDPLGARFYYTERLDVATVVGVVGDVSTSLTDPPEPYLYFSYAQAPSRFSSLAVRARGEPMELADAVREAVWRVDPDQPVWEIMPITERMAGHAGRERFAMVLLVAFGATALLLASLGLYGIMTYSVRQRERELGVRLALGAGPRSVLGLVMRQGLGLTVLGLGVGVVLAWWLSGLLESLLYGVQPRDPWSFGVAVALLATVAAVAAFLPARRAVALDPAETLHEG